MNCLLLGWGEESAGISRVTGANEIIYWTSCNVQGKDLKNLNSVEKSNEQRDFPPRKSVSANTNFSRNAKLQIAPEVEGSGLAYHGLIR